MIVQVLKQVCYDSHQYWSRFVVIVPVLKQVCCDSTSIESLPMVYVIDGVVMVESALCTFTIPPGLSLAHRELH